MRWSFFTEKSKYFILNFGLSVLEEYAKSFQLFLMNLEGHYFTEMREDDLSGLRKNNIKFKFFDL
jgi:hypothetical protein